MLNKFLTISFLLALNFVSGSDALEKCDLRILKLIPSNWVGYPAIEPAIPANFVMVESKENSSIIWGDHESVQAFKQDPTNIISNLILLKHSTNVIQTGPSSFSIESELELVAKMLNVKIRTNKTCWGNYPVLCMDIERNGKTYRGALVGLNSPHQWVIEIKFLQPEGKKLTTKIWDDFLANTKELDEMERLRALGMDMHEGYTFYGISPRTVKATVEKRKSDNLLAVMVEPQPGNITYEIESVSEALMGTEWKCGEPCAKIHGTAHIADQSAHIGHTITVVTKEVDDFSFDLDPEKHPKGVVIYAQEGL